MGEDGEGVKDEAGPVVASEMDMVAVFEPSRVFQRGLVRWRSESRRGTRRRRWVRFNSLRRRS